MLRIRLALLVLALPALLLLALSLNLLIIPPVTAQLNTPIPYTPGSPLQTITPTVPFNQCFSPLRLAPGDAIFILPGVNIRNAPTQSSALVWNTNYDNRDEDGELVDAPRLVAATIVSGPVCAEGFNWWQIEGTRNPGWVAEGRPEDGNGYNLVTVDTARTAPCTPQFNLAVGAPVTLQYNVRIREAPILSGRTLTVVPFQTPIAIVGGSQCVDGLLWWYVRATVLGQVYEGWMAEGANERQYLLPLDLPSTERGTLCGAPLPLLAGQRAFVHYRDSEPKALRAAPGTAAPLLFTLVEGVPFIIEGGPACADNMNWWRVRVLASTPVVGWLSEGSAFAGYWIATLNPNEFAR
ncbi:MAG: hypothetical protein MUE40_18615 [Anaerolineae bacterium]|jgi:hypothetical protein|nr:hypothetical protein [Anaerolineae bacterium]